MKQDTSKILHDKYFKLANKNIEVILKNGNVIKGVIIGFVKGDIHKKESYIIKWHIADEKYMLTIGLDAFGFPIGNIIRQADIQKIFFYQDNSILEFK